MGKKASGAAKRRKAAAAQRRAERVAYVRRKDETKPDIGDGGGYWHGGWPGLEPGTVLVGSAEASQHGVDTARYMSPEIDGEWTPYDPGRVYFSSRKDFARAFAAQTRISDVTTGLAFQRGALYRVEPLGDIEADPDFLIGGVSWCAPRARIVAVEDANVMMDAYTAIEHIGPYMTWRDGSPVYSEAGEYLLSPEQIESGQDHSRLVSLLPWTPVEHVNAALTGDPSGDRPRAEDHPEIALGADEAAAVRLRHYARATQLMQSGVEFSNDYAAVRDDVNKLIEPNELSTEDSRGAVVALHPQDGVIGACVVTVVEMGDQLVMFIDRVAVAPAWQRRGLGSVLLTTVQQLLPRTVDFAAGHCAPDVAPFFAQMGYTVLTPSVPLALPVHKHEKDLQPIQVPGDCWFYRQGRI